MFFFSEVVCECSQARLSKGCLSYCLIILGKAVLCSFGFRVLALTLQRTSDGIQPGQELWDCDPG